MVYRTRTRRSPRRRLRSTVVLAPALEVLEVLVLDQKARRTRGRQNYVLLPRISS